MPSSLILVGGAVAVATALGAAVWLSRTVFGRSFMRSCGLSETEADRELAAELIAEPQVPVERLRTADECSQHGCSGCLGGACFGWCERRPVKVAADPVPAIACGHPDCEYRAIYNYCPDPAHALPQAAQSDTA